ncbi:M1 family metallopeptidase [Myroides sp. LJL119]
MKKNLFVFFGLLAFLTSCQEKSSSNQNVALSVDNQTYADLDKARITNLHWDVNVDFENKILQASATYDFLNNNASEIFFDTDNIQIDSVLLSDQRKANYTLFARDSIKGSALKVDISPVDSIVSIYYKTSPHAGALQWLEPEQTYDKKYPFLLTQGQAILTRTYIPIQDSPSVRITYSADVQVPKELMAVMSATNPKEKTADGLYHFQMNQPIPAYLIAIAVGDIAYQGIDHRTGVYAEPGLLEKAAYELAQVGQMVQAAESLYGPYPWEQYDVLILPPSFPFGGMENPRLTFATPTILVGDRSLTNLIAHELAHSWSGNLVTNATWDDFWLNEGFTVYFERRIMEKIAGKDYADMLSVIGYQDLKTSMDLIDNHYTSLYIDLSNRNPDDAFSDVPYDKGYLFLKMLEDRYSREKFDAFLKKYFSDNAFKTMTTKDFVVYLKQNLTNGEDDFVQNWIYDTGWPTAFTAPNSQLMDQVEKVYNQDLAEFKLAENFPAKPGIWSTNEYVHYIRLIDPEKLTPQDLQKMDQMYDFTNSNNAEIQCAWYEKAFLIGYDKVNDNAQEFMTHVGRRKFLEPLYLALINSGQEELANQIYQKARGNYHFVARQTIDSYLAYKAN